MSKPSPIILPFKGVMPTIHETAFIAPGAVIIGDVVVGAETSIWPGCVVRADMGCVRIGARVNIQDGTVVHITEGQKGSFIGDGVTIGHQALIHECTLEDQAFIGMKASVMDGAIVRKGGMLAAGALLTQNKVVGENTIWRGSPAKYWRDVTAEESESFKSRAGEYAALAKIYREEL